MRKLLLLKVLPDWYAFSIGDRFVQYITFIVHENRLPYFATMQERPKYLSLLDPMVQTIDIVNTRYYKNLRKRKIVV